MDKRPNAQQIYDALRGMIIELQVMPGSRVTENQLADYFEVSRTPVRAALQRLESEGFLSIKPKQGCFIRAIDILTISHYYDVRVALENSVLEEVCKLQDQQSLQALAQRWNPETALFGLDVSDELKAAEEAFHQDLALIGQNPVLVHYIEDVNDHIRAVRRLGWPNSKSVTDTYEEHYRICQLLLARDLKQAQSEMTNHIRKSQDQASRVTLHQLYGNKNLIRFE